MNLSLTVKIGQIKISFLCPSKEWHSFIIRNYRPFLAGSGGSAAFRVVIERGIRAPALCGELKVQRAADVWQISRYDFWSRSSFAFRDTSLSVEKNKYAFDSWLRVFFTLCGASSQTLLLHGAGYGSKSGVFVFPGRSGKGKSTLIRMLGRTGALSDELVCVFKKGGGFFAASTPFWGELKKGTRRPFSGRIRKLVFLEHGTENRLDKATLRDSVINVLKTALFFSREKRHVNYLLAYAQALANRVPPRVLTFRKDLKRNELLKILNREDA